MSTGGWIAIGLGVAGLAYVGYKLTAGSSGGAGAPAAAAGATSGPTSLLGKIGAAVSGRGPGNYNPSGASALKPSNFIGQHVERKDSIAPAILGKFGVPSSITKPIASIASKLDVSGYVENYVGGKVSGALSKIGI
jgi:hypothetical protein